MANAVLIDGQTFTYTALTIVQGGLLPNTPAGGGPYASFSAANVVLSDGTAGAINNALAVDNPVAKSYAQGTAAVVPLSRIRSAA